MLIAHIGQRPGKHAGGLRSLLVGQAVLLGLGVGSLAVVLGPLGFEPQALGLVPVGIKTLLFGLGLALLFVVVVGPVLMRVPNWLGLGGFEDTLSKLARLPAWYLVLAVVVGGAVEEVLYRGVSLAVFEALGVAPPLAAPIIVLVFAAAHIPMWGVGPAVTTARSGALLTGFYLWHGDLLANIIAHTLTDFVGIALGPLVAAWRRRNRR